MVVKGQQLLSRCASSHRHVSKVFFHRPTTASTLLSYRPTTVSLYLPAFRPCTRPRLDPCTRRCMYSRSRRRSPLQTWLQTTGRLALGAPRHVLVLASNACPPRLACMIWLAIPSCLLCLIPHPSMLIPTPSTLNTKSLCLTRHLTCPPCV